MDSSRRRIPTTSTHGGARDHRGHGGSLGRVDGLLLALDPYVHMKLPYQVNQETRLCTAGSYLHLPKKTMEDEGLHIQKDIKTSGDSMSSKMQDLQSTANGTENVGGKSLENRMQLFV